MEGIEIKHTENPLIYNKREAEYTMEMDVFNKIMLGKLSRMHVKQ